MGQPSCGGFTMVWRRKNSNMKTTVRLLILLPLLCQGLENVNGEVVETPICDPKLQQKYCQAQYGGDVHTGCKYCGIGKCLVWKKNVKRGCWRHYNGNNLLLTQFLYLDIIIATETIFWKQKKQLEEYCQITKFCRLLLMR